MGKIITSPVKKWPGTVTLSDPLSLPQAVKFQESIRDARNTYNKAFEAAGIDTDLQNAKEVDFEKIELSTAELSEVRLEAVLDCVEEWNLEGIESPPNPFPGSPAISSARLMQWLIGEITKLLTEDEEAPNE